MSEASDPRAILARQSRRRRPVAPLAVALLVVLPIAHSAPSIAEAEGATCGDGDREGAEECDDGAQNSDSAPNACRTDCTRARCGDGARDRREQCDLGPANHAKIPNQCRPNCRNPHCGDGVVDDGEECDDGNTNRNDGCHQCKRCLGVTDGLTVTQDTKLCPGEYSVNDGGQPGVITVQGRGIVLDCNGARIRSSSRTRSGTGILVENGPVVLRNCRVSGFATGIDLQRTGNLVVLNMACDNDVDFRTAGSGPNIGWANGCRQSVGADAAAKIRCSGIRRCPRPGSQQRAAPRRIRRPGTRR